MPRIKPLLVLCAALLTVTPAASADVNSDMNQFFNKLGFASNTTQPGVWQGQAAGYAYGGSLYARTQVKNVQLISMTLPDINAGCGGIDAYLGSFSFINGEQLQRFVKQIMSNAAGYFFDLALQTTVPEIKTAKDFLQKMASDINSMNLSSCQAAQGITHDARHDIDAKASKDFKEASDYFTSRKVSESGSHTDNNADSRVDQLSAALNSAKQSYDQYTTNMTRSHEYAEMASRTESMSGQMSEDLSQQFALYVMKHAPQDAEAILTNTSSPEIAERRRAMAWSFVQEQVQPGVDNAWRESRGDIGKGMESVPSGGGSQDIIADHQGHQAIIDQRTQDSNIRNDVKHQVDNMVTEYKGNIGDTQNSIHGEENIVDRQYSELKNNHKQEEIQQNNRYNEENKRQKLMPTPSEDALKQMVDDKKERLKGPL